MVRRKELVGALPAAAFGLLAAGLLAFPVVSGVHGRGGINIGALLATLPLSLSMGAAEWCLLRYRRQTREALRTTRDLKTFGRRARLALLAAVAQYLAAAIALTAVATWIAFTTGLVHPGAHLIYPELVVYLALGSAMFIALALQALGVRAVPVVACAVALAFELTWHELGIHRAAGGLRRPADRARRLRTSGCWRPPSATPSRYSINKGGITKCPT